MTEPTCPQCAGSGDIAIGSYEHGTLEYLQCPTCAYAEHRYQQGRREDPAARVCDWAEDEDGVWETACGEAWVSADGTSPSENRHRYCPFCGAEIREQPYREPEGEA